VCLGTGGERKKLPSIPSLQNNQLKKESKMNTDISEDEWAVA